MPNIRFCVEMPEQLYKMLEEKAKANGLTKDELVLMGITQVLDTL